MPGLGLQHEGEKPSLTLRSDRLKSALFQKSPWVKELEPQLEDEETDAQKSARILPMSGSAQVTTGTRRHNRGCRLSQSLQRDDRRASAGPRSPGPLCLPLLFGLDLWDPQLSPVVNSLHGSWEDPQFPWGQPPTTPEISV